MLFVSFVSLRPLVSTSAGDCVLAPLCELLFVRRILFGMTDGALVVVQGAIVGKCFGPGTVSTVFGATLFFSRFGSFAGFAAPGFLAERFGLVPAVWISAMACLLSLLSSLAYLVLERRRDAGGTSLHPSSNGSGPPNGNTRTFSNFISMALIPKAEFWLLVYVWSAVSSAVFTALHFGADIASSGLRLRHASSRAGLVSGLVLLFAGFASPAFGWFQDHLGQRIYLLSGALAMCCIGLICGIIGLMSSAWLFAPGILLIALGFAIAPVTLLSCVSLVLDHESLPAALGLYKASENLALSLTHWAAGVLRDLSSTYTSTLLFLATIAASGSLAALMLRNCEGRDVLDESAGHEIAYEATAFEVLEVGI
jgi:MFS family permease